jgi:hypothetical protein
MSRAMGCRGEMYGPRDRTIVAYTASCAVVLEAQQPVDRAGAMENAQSAFPTAPWTAHRTRRPQRPTGIRLFRFEKGRTRTTTMTRLNQGG